LADHGAPITALDFTEPYGTLVTAGQDDVVKVWDLCDGEEVGKLRGHKGRSNGYAETPRVDERLSQARSKRYRWKTTFASVGDQTVPYTCGICEWSKTTRSGFNRTKSVRARDWMGCISKTRPRPRRN
jgi:WD40 repeat protein